jgi:hypothetical protein
MQLLFLGTEHFSDGSMAKKLFLFFVSGLERRSGNRSEPSHDFAHHSR